MIDGQTRFLCGLFVEVSFGTSEDFTRLLVIRKDAKAERLGKHQEKVLGLVLQDATIVAVIIVSFRDAKRKRRGKKGKGKDPKLTSGRKASTLEISP